MSPIIVRESDRVEKAVYHDDARSHSAQIKFPGQLEVVPPVQFRLWSLFEMANATLTK